MEHIARRPVLTSLPNVLTYARIAAVPAVVACLYFDRGDTGRWLALIVYTAACITDWLDGYLARRLGQTSKFGAFLDPVADKLMIAVVLVLILQADPRVIIALVAAIIIGREIAVSALREWMAELGARSRVAVSGIGKAKTTMQMIGLGCMLFTRPVFDIPVYDIGLALLIVAAGITLWSMGGYIRAAWPRVREREQVS
jgi:CDP-diacylglycerol--glycerol-3-phosphate 3-phosphatidyltransferase